MSSSGQAALVIGAAQGIGYACAEALLQNGTKVAVISSTYVVMKHLSKEHGGAGGVIVFISSRRGLQPFYGLIPVYGATKHGVIGFMQDWADENSYSVTGVRMGVLCPSLVETELGRLVPTKSLRPELCKKVFADLHLQSLKPCDVAQTFMRFVKEPDLHGKGLTVVMVDGEVNISLSQHAPF